VSAPFRSQRIEEIRREFIEAHAGLGRLLASPDGGELVSYLEARFFNGDLMGDTPEETAFNLGAREVVRVMRDIRDLMRRPKE
jgi:hypothetical protein